LYELKELGGWRSLEMVLRYAHLVDNDHLVGVVKRFSGSRLRNGAVPDTIIGTAAENQKGSVAGTL
jgi:hypothetical protein